MKLPYSADVQRNWATHVPNANTAAVVTLAATSGHYNVIQKIVGGYDGTPTGGSLVITDGVKTTTIYVPASGVVDIDFCHGWEGGQGLEVTVTLAAGGGTVKGALNVQYA